MGWASQVSWDSQSVSQVWSDRFGWDSRIESVRSGQSVRSIALYTMTVAFMVVMISHYFGAHWLRSRLYGEPLGQFLFFHTIKYCLQPNLRLAYTLPAPPKSSLGILLSTPLPIPLPCLTTPPATSQTPNPLFPWHSLSLQLGGVGGGGK